MILVAVLTLGLYYLNYRKRRTHVLNERMLDRPDVGGFSNPVYNTEETTSNDTHYDDVSFNYHKPEDVDDMYNEPNNDDDYIEVEDESEDE